MKLRIRNFLVIEMKNIFNSNEKMEGYLVGLIIGDGHIEPSKRVVIASSNEIFMKKISELFSDMKYRYSIFHDKSAMVWKISINSQELHKNLTEFYKIPTGNKTFTEFEPNLAENQLDSFIAGIFDAEGWYEKDKGKYLKIRIKMKNKSIISYIRKILSDKGYQPKGHSKADGSFVVEVNKQINVRKFLKTFNLLHPKWSNMRE